MPVLCVVIHANSLSRSQKGRRTCTEHWAAAAPIDLTFRLSPFTAAAVAQTQPCFAPTMAALYAGGVKAGRLDRPPKLLLEPEGSRRRNLAVIAAPMPLPPPSISTPSMNTPPPRPDGQVHNRLPEVMVHVNWYLFSPQARLARDVGVSRSTLSRLLSGRSAPSFSLAWRIAKSLEKRLGPKLAGRALDPGELFSLDGTYPTASACALVGCPGCRLAGANR